MELKIQSVYENGGKEGLYRAIADLVVDRMMQLYCETREKFHMIDEETQKNIVQRYSTDSMGRMPASLKINLEIS